MSMASSGPLSGGGAGMRSGHNAPRPVKPVTCTRGRRPPIPIFPYIASMGGRWRGARGSRARITKAGGQASGMGAAASIDSLRVPRNVRLASEAVLSARPKPSAPAEGQAKLKELRRVARV